MTHHFGTTTNFTVDTTDALRSGPSGWSSMTCAARWPRCCLTATARLRTSSWTTAASSTWSIATSVAWPIWFCVPAARISRFACGCAPRRVGSKIWRYERDAKARLYSCAESEWSPDVTGAAAGEPTTGEGRLYLEYRYPTGWDRDLHTNDPEGDTASSPELARQAVVIHSADYSPVCSVQHNDKLYCTYAGQIIVPPRVGHRFDCAPPAARSRQRNRRRDPRTWGEPGRDQRDVGIEIAPATSHNARGWTLFSVGTGRSPPNWGSGRAGLSARAETSSNGNETARDARRKFADQIPGSPTKPDSCQESC